MSAERRSLLPTLRRLSHSQRGTLLAYVAIIVLFVIGGIYRPSFVRPDNIGLLLLLASFIGLVAAGQTFVILIWGIDLSVPWGLHALAGPPTPASLGQNSRAWAVVPPVLNVRLRIG